MFPKTSLHSRGIYFFNHPTLGGSATISAVEGEKGEVRMMQNEDRT